MSPFPACLGLAALLVSAADCPAQTLRMTAAQKRVVKALGSPTRLVCDKVSLKRVAEHLARLHRIDIELDRKALDEAGLAADMPVTEHFAGVSLRSALRLMLRDRQLDYVLQGGTILITTEAEARTRLFAAGYPVGDLVGARAAGGAMQLSTKDLVTAIRECIAPATWKGSDCGAGTVRAVPPGQPHFLLVRQTAPVQHRVADFLEHVRYTVRSKRGRPTEAARRSSLRLANEQRIREALDHPTEFEFVEAPLADVLTDLQHRHQIPIRIDRASLDDVGIGENEPITRSLSGISLGAALRLVLRELDLVWVIHNEVVLITTPQDSEHRLMSTRFHPVDEPAERRGPAGLYRVDDDWLLDTITRTVHPVGWEDVGGPGCIKAIRKGPARSLVVTQQQWVHDELDTLLADLRRAAVAGSGDVRPDGTLTGPSVAEKKIRRKLDEPTTLAFTDVPLQDVADCLAKLHGVEVQIDHGALEDMGLGTDTPITCRLKGVSLESALRLMLRQLDLVFEVRDEVLLITTPEEAEQRLTTKVYPVTDLMPSVRARWSSLDTIVDSVASTVEPTTWDDVGGPGSMAAIIMGEERVLVISQTREVHRQVAELFGGLRRIAASVAVAKPTKRPIPPAADRAFAVPDAERRIAEALASPTTLWFIETPLQDVVDYLKDLHGIEIQLDRRALDDVGLDTATPITKHLKGVSLRAGLRLLLRELDLVYVVQDQVLLITTPEQAESRLDVRLYPVSDLMRRRGGRSPGFDALIDAITSTIHPTMWDEVGGPGSIAPITVGRARVLVVAQTDDAHQEVAQLLRRLRGAAGLEPAGTPAAAPPSTAADKAERSLRLPVTLQVVQSPLADAVDQLKRQASVKIQFDKRAMDDVGVGTDSPVSRDLRRVVLAHALDAILHDLKLTWFVEGGVIVVTTPEQAKSRLLTEVYPINWSIAGRYAPGLHDRDAWLLAERIVEKLAPNTWDEVGGPGSIAPLSFGRRDVLVVSQTWKVHRQLARALGHKPHRP